MNATTSNTMFILGLAAAALLGTGCTALPDDEFATDDSPSLALLGLANPVPPALPGPASSTGTGSPAISAHARAVSPQTRAFYLGAGDTLGQAIFANYVALVQANAPSTKAMMSGPVKSDELAQPE